MTDPDQAVLRVAAALGLPPALLGNPGEVNHWSAWRAVAATPPAVSTPVDPMEGAEVTDG